MSIENAGSGGVEFLWEVCDGDVRPGVAGEGGIITEGLFARLPVHKPAASVHIVTDAYQADLASCYLIFTNLVSYPCVAGHVEHIHAVCITRAGQACDAEDRGRAEASIPQQCCSLQPGSLGWGW
jgi:hypothetical protein